MRIAFNIALILSLLFLPWWAGAIIALSGAFLVDGFFEVIIYGIISDALYGTSLGFHGFTHVGAIYAVIVFALGSVVQKRLAW